MARGGAELSKRYPSFGRTVWSCENQVEVDKWRLKLCHLEASAPQFLNFINETLQEQPVYRTSHDLVGPPLFIRQHDEGPKLFVWCLLMGLNRLKPSTHVELV